MGTGASAGLSDAVKAAKADEISKALAAGEGPAKQVAAAVSSSSLASISEAFADMSDADRQRLKSLLTASDSGAGLPTASDFAFESKTVEPDGDPNANIPPEWGWPKEPFEPEDLAEYVIKATEATYQEKWDEQLEARAISSKREDFIEEKAFANLLLNKEGTGEEKEGRGYKSLDIRAYEKGKWYRFLNHKGDCFVYVHNFTRDVTASRPPNFKDLTDEEKKRLKKIGTYIKELPRELERVYDTQKAIPVVYASQATCEALKTFFVYDKNSQLLDATQLKRVNIKALEESRQAIVNAMTLGKTLCVYLGDVVPDFQEKICTGKNREYFPLAVFRHGGLDSDMIKDKIYRDEEKENGECVCREGFRVALIVMYDGLDFQLSSMKKEELPAKIPDFMHMHEIRTYNDDDKKKILEQMRK